MFSSHAQTLGSPGKVAGGQQATAFLLPDLQLPPSQLCEGRKLSIVSATVQMYLKVM